MAAHIDDLTDKEKETLRLIVRGHDAKSAASELTLSVHTINERLRAARRKLEVTSSREAARLLFESEAQAPEKLVTRQLGDVSAAALADQPRTTRHRTNAALWFGGIFAMSLVFALLALSMTGGSAAPASDQSAPPSATSVSDQKDFEAREAAAREWLLLTDAQDWQGGFDKTANVWRHELTLAAWIKAGEEVRAPMGRVLSRKLDQYGAITAPPADYKMVIFETDFENRKGVTETVVLQQEDGVWKVSGYWFDDPARAQ